MEKGQVGVEYVKHGRDKGKGCLGLRKDFLRMEGDAWGGLL